MQAWSWPKATISTLTGSNGYKNSGNMDSGIIHALVYMITGWVYIGMY